MPASKKPSDGTKKRTSSRAKKTAAPAAEPLLTQATTTSEPTNGNALNGHAEVEAQIRQRAYELFVERGGHNGNAEQDWLKAESEVYARRTV